MRSAFLLLVLLAPAVLADDAKSKRGPVKLTEQALAIHRDALLIDGHNDLPYQFRERKDLGFRSIDIARDQPALHTDLPRLRKGGVGAQFWAAYIPVETVKQGTAVRDTLEQIDVIHRLVKAYPNDLEMALTADDIERIRKKGKIASLIGVEGGHSIADSLGVLRTFHALGVRYMTLTHSESTSWADSATDEARHQGLTKFGEDVVREMNRLGMLVDISHVSADTMRDVLKVTKAPVMASHSSAYAVAPHPRNVPDDVLETVAKNGGVVMVNFYSGFITRDGAERGKAMYAEMRKLRKQYPDEQKFEEAMKEWRKSRPLPRGTIHDVVDHIDHIVKVAGIDHVGLGSDFDGIGSTPEQLDDVSRFPYLTQELLNRGYTKEQIHKILGGNILRVMRAAEKVAREADKR